MFIRWKKTKVMSDLILHFKLKSNFCLHKCIKCIITHCKYNPYIIGDSFELGKSKVCLLQCFIRKIPNTLDDKWPVEHKASLASEQPEETNPVKEGLKRTVQGDFSKRAHRIFTGILHHSNSSIAKLLNQNVYDDCHFSLISTVAKALVITKH